MKYITGVAVLIALLGQEQTQAIKLSHDSFSEDLVKSLAEDMAKDQNEQTAEAAPAEEAKKEEAPKPAAAKKADNATKKTNATKKAPAAKDAKKAANATKAAAPAKKKEEEQEIPMDQAAIKAYSSVIADAAEDSEPQTPVVYHEVVKEEPKNAHESIADPMASMIQNEISSIKDASIKAAKEQDWSLSPESAEMRKT